MQLPVLGDVSVVIALRVAAVSVHGSHVPPGVSTATLRMPRVHAVETVTLNSPLFGVHDPSNPSAAAVGGSGGDSRLRRNGRWSWCAYKELKLTLSVLPPTTFTPPVQTPQ